MGRLEGCLRGRTDRSSRWLPPRRRKLEAREAETRRNGAADQRPLAERLRRLPRAGRYHALRPFALRKVRTETDRLYRCAIRGDPQQKRRAGMEMPDLDRVDTMPVRPLTCLQQEVDRGRTRASVRTCRIPERLMEMSALRMRCEPEQADDRVG